MNNPLGPLDDEECPTLASNENGERPDQPASVLAKELTRGRYQPATEIARGGMGKVLAAVEDPLRRTVALKVLLDPRDAGNQERFIREARITGGLEHPSIIPVHELSVDEDGRVFYTMKLVKGVTLLQILHDLAACDPATLRRYSIRLPPNHLPKGLRRRRLRTRPARTGHSPRPQAGKHHGG